MHTVKELLTEYQSNIVYNAWWFGIPVAWYCCPCYKTHYYTIGNHVQYEYNNLKHNNFVEES